MILLLNVTTGMRQALTRTPFNLYKDQVSTSSSVRTYLNPLMTLHNLCIKIDKGNTIRIFKPLD